MGQAKQRGTFEQRLKLAQERKQRVDEIKTKARSAPQRDHGAVALMAALSLARFGVGFRRN